MIRFLALTTLFFGLWGTTAFAQPVVADDFESPAFQAFLESDFAVRLRREALERSMILHEPGCVEPMVFDVTRTTQVSPITMGEDSIAPTEGMWQERLSRTACEETVTENVVHTFTAEGQRSFLLVRGRTEASLETQLTLINDARDVAAGHDIAFACDIIRFTDTSVTNDYGDGRRLERWQVDACGEAIDLDVLFNAGSQSEETYTISAAE